MKKNLLAFLPWLLVVLLAAIIAFLLGRKPAPPKKDPPRQPDSGATEIVGRSPKQTAKPPVSSAGMELPRP